MRALPPLLLVLASFLAACGDTQQYDEVRTVERDLVLDADSSRRFAAVMPRPQAAAPATAPFVAVVPEGWEARPPTSIRAMNYAVAGGAECYLSILGGSVLDNVNRWRREMGLGPIDEAALAALPRIAVLGAERPLVDCAGNYAGAGGAQVADARLLGVVWADGDRTVTVKFVGPVEAVTAAEPAFRAFCASLAARPADGAADGR